MSATQQTLAQMIRSKYPGQYDDLSDTDLETKTLAKYPQYSDVPRTIPSNYAAAQFPELQKDDFSHTLYNMTAAQSGQKLATPQDQAIGEQGKAAGFEAAGVTALTSLGGELLAAPKLLQVAARDPATGQFVRGLATQEGPTLLAQGVKAVQAAGEAHPLVKQALIQGLTMLGAGKIAHYLGWLGQPQP